MFLNDKKLVVFFKYYYCWIDIVMYLALTLPPCVDISVEGYFFFFLSFFSLVSIYFDHI